MTGYAPADKSAQWFAGAYPGAKMTPNCGCIHTTETTGWPSYGGGKSAPNYTARPNFAAKRLDFRQHFPDEMSARALVNAPGGVETNTANVVQIELVGTCDPKHAKSWNGSGASFAGTDYVHWSNPPEWALRSLAAFVVDQHARHGTPISGVPVWKPYPSSYGSANGVRLSASAWRAFKGWCGHQHVPENDHGDPGSFPFAQLYAIAEQLLNPQEDDMTPEQSAQLARIEAKLNAQMPEQWIAPDPSDPTKRRFKVVAKGTPGARLNTTASAMTGNALQVSIGGVADALGSGVQLDVESIDKIAAAVAKALPPGNAATAEQIAAQLIAQLRP